ncbi:15521_t:CDS:1, partial [Cetraspora pellucida]
DSDDNDTICDKNDDRTKIEKDTGPEPINDPTFKLASFEAANNRPLYRLEPPNL